MFTKPFSFPLFALLTLTRYNCVEEESVGDGRRVLSPDTTCPLVLALVPSFRTRLQSTTRIERWSLVNAVAVLLAAMGTVWLRALDPILIVGVAMLGGLAGIEWARWTPDGTFGVANGVTALRVGLLGVLAPVASVGPWPLVALSLFFLGLDGLDGWLARRYQLSSSFGAFFDKETDALFLLLLCGLTAFQGILPLWIVGAGLLRYGFVVVLFLLPTPQKTESRSSLARYVFGGVVGALLASFLLPPGLSRPLVAVATAALLVSFGWSLWGIVAPQWVLRES